MAAIVVGLGLSACSADTSELEDAANDLEEKMNETADEMDKEIDKAEGEKETMSNVMYQCPDDCENGPAYFDPGPCKKCGKEMIEI